MATSPAPRFKHRLIPPEHSPGQTQSSRWEKIMKFLFRANMQLCAGPMQKQALGFRAAAVHVSSIAEAAERFLRDQLSRKRAKTFQVSPPGWQ
jgi:hypothetical protein